MTTRFTVTDHVAAANAAAELPTAARHLAAVVTETVAALAALPAAADPQQVLDAYAAHRRGQAAIRPAENQVLLLLHLAGASATGLSNALGVNRLTVERRIAAAKTELDA